MNEIDSEHGICFGCLCILDRFRDNLEVAAYLSKDWFAKKAGLGQTGVHSLELVLVAKAWDLRFPSVYLMLIHTDGYGV
jgi:hypothetical protein